MGSLSPQRRTVSFISASITLTSTICPSLVRLPMCFLCVYTAASTVGEKKEHNRADSFMITCSDRASIWPSHFSVVNSLFHSSGLYFSLLFLSRDSHLFTEKIELLQLLLPRHKSTRILLCSYRNRAAVAPQVWDQFLHLRLFDPISLTLSRALPTSFLSPVDWCLLCECMLPLTSLT